MKLKKLAALICAFGFCTIPLVACEDQIDDLHNSSPSTEIVSNSTNSSNGSNSENSSSQSTTPPPLPPQDSSSAPSPAPPPVVEPVIETVSYARCTGNGVNLRSGAGTGYAVLGSAEKGTVYAITGKTGSWYKTYYRGKTAYISASYVSVFELEKTDNKTEKVLREGYKLIGVPYVYGAVRLHDGKGNLLKGFTSQAFDCSSLVQYVFYKGASKNLQVNTRTQITQGKYVAPSKLQRGDCIYFTNADRQYNTGIERVGHVAIYLGNDYILHTASDYARIEKMTTQRWNYYVEARRFL